MHQIRYYLALSETLNFTQAAERCHVSQPSLTRAIHALEAELGGELLRRERALSHLTELGERMLPLLRQCHDAAAAAKAVAQSFKKGETAPLAVSVSDTVGLTSFTPMLHELAHKVPGLQLKLGRGSGGEIAESLKAGETDLAIAGPLGEAWTRLDTYPLYEESFELCVNRRHRLSGKNQVRFKELVSERLLINVACEMAGVVTDLMQAQGIALKTSHQVASQADLLTLIEANMGIAIVPAGMARTEGVGRVPLEDRVARKVSAYCVAGRRRAAPCTSLLNMLRAHDWSAGAGVH